uniref:proline-rich protein 2-like n=1 Tax=Agelaius phoeniceus TaxID=39638 RepID=UPI0023EB39D2|nr:proline-rich protein 2-like [Agelaius phoeniceus]
MAAPAPPQPPQARASGARRIFHGPPAGSRAAAPTERPHPPGTLQQPRVGRTQPGIAQPGSAQPGIAQPGSAQPRGAQRSIPAPGAAKRGEGRLSAGSPGDAPRPALSPGLLAALSPRSPWPWEPAAWAGGGGGRECAGAAGRAARRVREPPCASCRMHHKDHHSPPAPPRHWPALGMTHPSTPQYPTSTPTPGPSRLIDSAPSQWTSVAAGGAGGPRLQEGRERRGQSRRLDRGPSGTGSGSAPRPAPPSRRLPAPQHR